MKTTKSILLGLLSIFLVANVTAQSMSKKFRTVKVETKINAPASKVWKAMVLDYGAISNFSPYIYSSEYINGSLKGEVGATRKCNFDTKGKQWSHERIASLDNENMIMKNWLFDGAKLPMNFDNSQAIYRVKDNGDGTCTASYEFQFRTKPSFMGALIKGSFKKQMSGTLIGLRHYVETGEKVTPMNGKYKEIKNNYPKAKLVK